MSGRAARLVVEEGRGGTFLQEALRSLGLEVHVLAAAELLVGEPGPSTSAAIVDCTPGTIRALLGRPALLGAPALFILEPAELQSFMPLRREAGHDFIVKPFSLEELASRLDSLCAAPRGAGGGAADATQGRWEDFRLLQELKDYFTVTLSAEFTTHLARARAHLKFLEKALDPQKQQGYIVKAFTDADESFQQLEQRIRLLLDYGDLFRRRDEPGKDLVLLQDLLQKSAESLHGELQRRKILLRVTLNPRLGPIKSDKEKLLQVFFHLLKFMADRVSEGDVLEIVGTEEERNLRFEFLSQALPSFRPDYLGVIGVQREPAGLPPLRNLDITIVSHLVEDCAGTLEPLHKEGRQVGLVMRLPRNYRIPAEVLADIRSRVKVMELLED